MVKRSVRVDKRRWMTDAENAAKLNQMGTLCKITKRLRNNRKTHLAGVHNKDIHLNQEDLV